jgi:hypothetical protein
MTKQLRPIALVACIAAFSSFPTLSVQAKQQCSAAMPAEPHGQWWSYRLIDGRKCWYEGKPMLAKSELEWSRQASTKQASTTPEAKAAPASMHVDKPNDPMNAQARAPADADSFDARWRARIEQAILEEFGGSTDKPRSAKGRRL